MRSLLFISLTLLISSCSSQRFQGMRAMETPSYSAMLVDASFQSVIYNTSLKFKDKQFSGLFIVKKMPDQSIRMTMTPKIGPTLFDFEFTADKEFIVHNSLEKMDRPIILRAIEKDLRLLFGINFPIKRTKWRLDEGQNQAVLKVKTNKSANYYYVDYKTGNLAAAKKVSIWAREKVSVVYNVYKDDFPSEMKIQHQHLPLSLNFKLIKKR